MRSNKADLYAVLALINAATGNSQKPWVQQADGRWASIPGTYVLDWCYGGVRLAQIANESGGERDITGRGTKRETYHRMHEFLRGLEAA